MGFGWQFFTPPSRPGPPPPMPSSRTAAARAHTVRPASLTRLLEALEQVPDPRARRGVRHSWSGMVAAGIAAVTAGARSLRAIAEWVADQDAETLAMLGLTGSRAPSEPTIRRVLTAIDADELDRVLGAWMWTRTQTGPDGRRVIALDGKTVRGARDHHLPQGAPGTVAPHLVSAYDHNTGTVLGQLAVAAKTNEIPAVRLVLKGFDLTDVVVTVDAMHTQDRHRRADHQRRRPLRVHRQSQHPDPARGLQEAALETRPRTHLGPDRSR